MERSTGCRKKTDAEAVGNAYEDKLRKAEIEGVALSKEAVTVTVSDCILSYVERPGGIKPYDI